MLAHVTTTSVSKTKDLGTENVSPFAGNAASPSGFVQLITYSDPLCTKISSSAYTYGVNVCVKLQLSAGRPSFQILNDTIFNTIYYLQQYSDATCGQTSGASNMLITDLCYSNGVGTYSQATFSINKPPKPAGLSNPAILR